MLSERNKRSIAKGQGSLCPSKKIRVTEEDGPFFVQVKKKRDHSDGLIEEEVEELTDPFEIKVFVRHPVSRVGDRERRYIKDMGLFKLGSWVLHRSYKSSTGEKKTMVWVNLLYTTAYEDSNFSEGFLHKDDLGGVWYSTTQTHGAPKPSWSSFVLFNPHFDIEDSFLEACARDDDEKFPIPLQSCCSLRVSGNCYSFPVNPVTKAMLKSAGTVSLENFYFSGDEELIKKQFYAHFKGSQRKVDFVDTKGVFFPCMRPFMEPVTKIRFSIGGLQPFDQFQACINNESTPPLRALKSLKIIYCKDYSGRQGRCIKFDKKDAWQQIVDERRAPKVVPALFPSCTTLVMKGWLMEVGDFRRAAIAGMKQLRSLILDKITFVDGFYLCEDFWTMDSLETVHTYFRVVHRGRLPGGERQKGDDICCINEMARWDLCSELMVKKLSQKRVPRLAPIRNFTVHVENHPTVDCCEKHSIPYVHFFDHGIHIAFLEVLDALMPALRYLCVSLERRCFLSSLPPHHTMEPVCLVCNVLGHPEKEAPLGTIVFPSSLNRLTVYSAYQYDELMPPFKFYRRLFPLLDFSPCVAVKELRLSCINLKNTTPNSGINSFSSENRVESSAFLAALFNREKSEALTHLEDLEIHFVGALEVGGGGADSFDTMKLWSSISRMPRLKKLVLTGAMLFMPFSMPTLLPGSLSALTDFELRAYLCPGPSTSGRGGEEEAERDLFLYHGAGRVMSMLTKLRFESINPKVGVGIRDLLQSQYVLPLDLVYNERLMTFFFPPHEIAAHGGLSVFMGLRGFKKDLVVPSLSILASKALFNGMREVLRTQQVAPLTINDLEKCLGDRSDVFNDDLKVELLGGVLFCVGCRDFVINGNAFLRVRGEMMAKDSVGSLVYRYTVEGCFCSTGCWEVFRRGLFSDGLLFESIGLKLVEISEDGDSSLGTTIVEEREG